MDSKQYTKSVHKAGRIWMLSALALMLLVPIFITVYFDASPSATDIFIGLIGVAPVFWTVGVIEMLTYVPMLGAAGSYLGFVTGNVTNLKVPAALNAMEMAKAKAGSEEGEIASTIAIGVSSIITVIILSFGVLMLSQLQPILQSPTLKPAFDNILPALFGGLAVVFVAKNPKIAVAPLVFMIALFVLVPSLASAVGILVPVGALVAIIVARILYNKGKL